MDTISTKLKLCLGDLFSEEEKNSPMYEAIEKLTIGTATKIEETGIVYKFRQFKNSSIVKYEFSSVLNTINLFRVKGVTKGIIVEYYSQKDKNDSVKKVTRILNDDLDSIYNVDYEVFHGEISTSKTSSQVDLEFNEIEVKKLNKKAFNY